MGMGFSWIFWVVVLGVAIWAVMRWNSNQSTTGEKSALDILKERYAKGEIDKEEFEARKKDLT